MTADTVTAEEVSDQEPVQEEQAQTEHVEVEQKVEEQVPLKALKKERKKRQEAELKNQWNEERIQQLLSKEPPKEDTSNFEAVTKGELKDYSQNERLEIIRTVKEENWMEENPDKSEVIDEKLEDLLKEKPHLSYAILHSKNRYKEAWDQLMGHDKINAPRVKQEKRENKAPGSPANMPKSAGVNQAVDIMKLSDSEFNEWRSTQRKRR